ncbi:MAG TPA: type II toxin-antitoxin system VapC family toxin [Terriglobales bacterium]|jgi:hypothetical protein
MIILDTNVLSALMLQSPDPAVVTWLNRQPRTSVWITSITVLEVRHGLEIMPPGKRRAALTAAFSAFLEVIERRVMGFDLEAAERAGSLMAECHRKGRPQDLRDTMIAGIVLAHHAVLATRNIGHFEDIGDVVVNPWM